MTFFSMMNESFTMGQQLELLARVVVATLCGVAVGFERNRRLKEAGIRTHCVVACAAALLMIVSKYGFADLALNGQTDFMGSRGADPSRIAAQIVSGIAWRVPLPVYSRIVFGRNECVRICNTNTTHNRREYNISRIQSADNFFVM